MHHPSSSPGQVGDGTRQENERNTNPQSCVVVLTFSLSLSRRCCSTHRISIILIQSASTRKAATTSFAGTTQNLVIVVVGLPGNKVVQSRPPVPTCPCRGIRTSSAKTLSSLPVPLRIRNQCRRRVPVSDLPSIPPLPLNTFFVSI